MQTLKTAIVVVLLLVVFYGVYEMLNRPPGEEPPDVASLDSSAMADLDIDLGDSSADLGAIDEPPSFGAGAPGVAPGNTTIASPESSSLNRAPTNSSFPPSSFPTAPFPESPAPPTSPGAAPSANAALARPPSGGFAGPFQAATDSSHAGSSHAGPASSNSNPAATATPPLPASGGTMAAGSSLAAAAGSSLLQHNPYINENIISKPNQPKASSKPLGARAYQNDLKTARSLIEAGKYRAALAKLSVFYKSQDLTAEQHRELLGLLDPLAGRVIYSREHLVEQPYTVGRNETLMEIAKKYNVPYQLLQKINGIENPSVLLPGSQLKVVPGPFRADVDLQAQELTVFLDQLYAGRFPITLGADPPPREGEFQVRDKRSDKTYFSMDGRTIPAANPANPFGGVWLDLGREVCIHGSPKQGADSRRGCISLSPRDAHDVYSILSVGSRIRILR